MAAAGRVGRPHGLDGSFHVTGAGDAGHLLEVGTPLRLGDDETSVDGRKGTDEHPIVRVGLASDRNGAEVLRGRELVVLDAAEPELDEDEYPAEQLVGCAVVDGERPLGEVRALLGLPTCEALELDTGLIVPMVRDAVRSIDVAAKRIDVDGGFLGAA